MLTLIQVNQKHLIYVLPEMNKLKTNLSLDTKGDKEATDDEYKFAIVH